MFRQVKLISIRQEDDDTIGNGAFMRIGSVQLDYPSKANSADEKGARNLEPTDIRLKVIFDNCFVDVRYQGLICCEERSLKQIPPPQGQIVASGRAVLVVDGFMDACDKCIGSAVIFSVSTPLGVDLFSTWTSGTAFGVS